MSFEWDKIKAAVNLRKHGIDFVDAVFVLEDPSALTLEDDTDGEERFITMGMDNLGRVLVVVYTWRGDQIRLISARRATRQERKKYEF
ncbi:MAG: BrnT family toxin [Lentisphaeria bacterium]|nr:BrnT family toxin [Lentisphaeria bacterium]